jgi:hypothetical protein
VFESGGTEYAQPFDAADALPPADSHLRLAPKSFSTSKGTKLHYADTEAATTTFKVLLLRNRSPDPARPPRPARAGPCIRPETSQLPPTIGT